MEHMFFFIITNIINCYAYDIEIFGRKKDENIELSL